MATTPDQYSAYNAKMSSGDPAQIQQAKADALSAGYSQKDIDWYNQQNGLLAPTPTTSPSYSNDPYAMLAQSSPMSFTSPAPSYNEPANFTNAISSTSTNAASSGNMMYPDGSYGTYQPLPAQQYTPTNNASFINPVATATNNGFGGQNGGKPAAQQSNATASLGMIPKPSENTTTPTANTATMNEVQAGTTFNQQVQFDAEGRVNIGTAADPHFVDPLTVSGLAKPKDTFMTKEQYLALRPTDTKPDTSNYLANQGAQQYIDIMNFSQLHNITPQQAQAQLASQSNQLGAQQYNAAQNQAAQMGPASLIDANNANLRANAITGNVDQRETSQYQLAQMTGQDSPLMQLAKQSGERMAAKRGLLNSSISAGASQAEMVKAAQPFALQDANTYYTSRAANQQAQNQAELANAQSQAALAQANAKAINDNSQFNTTAQNQAQLANQAAANDAFKNNQNADLAAQKANQDSNTQINLANAQAKNSMEQLNVSNDFDSKMLGYQQGLDTAKSAYLSNQDYVNKANLAATGNLLDIDKQYATSALQASLDASNAGLKGKQDVNAALLGRAQTALDNVDKTYANAVATQNQATLDILNQKITQENAAQMFGFDMTKLKTTQDFNSYIEKLKLASSERNTDVNAASQNYQAEMQAASQRAIKQMDVDNASYNSKLSFISSLQTGMVNNNVDWNTMGNVLDPLYENGLGAPKGYASQMFASQNASSNSVTSLDNTPDSGAVFKTDTAGNAKFNDYMQGLNKNDFNASNEQARTNTLQNYLQARSEAGKGGNTWDKVEAYSIKFGLDAHKVWDYVKGNGLDTSF